VKAIKAIAGTLACFGLLLGAAERSSAAPVVPTVRYTVVRGDTLSALARKYHTTVGILAGTNRIPNPNLIFVNQVLWIMPGDTGPVPALDPERASPVVHVALQAPRPVPPAPRPVPSTPGSGGLGGAWACIRAHESGGNYAENTGNGYYGAYQFALGTWRGLGGSGLPSNAPPAVQDAMAQKLQALAGWGQWPVTSRMCGV
jgi:hypothetical protein